jgi:hypothetical protein
MTIEAKIIEDSLAPNGRRLTTMVLRYPRFIHAEIMTHRSLCVDGDMLLEFDMPAAKNRKKSRMHNMTIRDFYHKWHYGVEEHRASRAKDIDLNLVDDDKIYTAKELANVLGYTSASNIRCSARNNGLHTLNKDKRKSEDHLIRGVDYKEFKRSRGKRTFSIRKRLQNMAIRQLDEKTMKVRHSNVVDCVYSGIKEIYQIVAGEHTFNGSKDHKVLTETGWKPISELIPGTDSVIVETAGVVDSEKSDPKKWKFIDGQWRNVWQYRVRPLIIARQNGLCDKCSEHLQGNADIHHVISVRDDKNKAYDINNVVAQGKPVPIEKITFIGLKDTYDLEIAGEFPNFICNGIVVHNSKNSSSSRAIPVRKIIDQILSDPVLPVKWVKNQKGMQGKDVLGQEEGLLAQEVWLKARDYCVQSAEKLIELGVHKQLANRILEPWSHISVVLSGTEWENFFTLRCHWMAEDNFQVLAEKMSEAYRSSVPRLLGEGEWHLPFVLSWERAALLEKTCAKLSTARCARVSYLNHDGSLCDHEKDVQLHDDLIVQKPAHASPSEHPAYALGPEDGDKCSGNIRGFVQYRKTIPGECATTFPWHEVQNEK